MVRKKKNLKKVLVASMSCALLLGSASSVQAYNAKFSFSNTSGVMSPWSYSSEATKFSKDENPVVKCTKTSGSTSKFEYDVANSNKESRVVTFTKSGKFNTTKFSRHTTVKGYKYRLRVCRHGGAWYSKARTDGYWNIDSY